MKDKIEIQTVSLNSSPILPPKNSTKSVDLYCKPVSFVPNPGFME